MLVEVRGGFTATLAQIKILLLLIVHFNELAFDPVSVRKVVSIRRKFEVLIRLMISVMNGFHGEHGAAGVLIRSVGLQIRPTIVMRCVI